MANDLKSITLSAAANTSTTERTATVTITAGEATTTITVVQAGLYLSVTPTEVSFGTAASKRIVSVNTNAPTLDAVSTAAWLTATVANDLKSITLSAAANTATAERTATVTISGSGLTATLSVKQAAYTDTDPLGLCPDTNHPHVIDMGIGVKFACCNVGADTPSDYGYYFAWGETMPKSTYNSSTYEWCNGSYDTLTKYCTNSNYGTVDSLSQLEFTDDAACAVMGGTWRMPTTAELDALSNNCTWTWISEGGHNGYLVTASNGHKLFLPAAGWRSGASCSGWDSYGYYWSSALDTFNSNFGQSLYFHSGSHSTSNFNRYYGRSIRAVTE